MVQCSFAAKSSWTDSCQKTSALESVPLKLNDTFAGRKEKETLRILAISLCIVSVIFNIVLCILGFVFASVRHSPATFAFAADCVLDFVSSSIVIWRYFGSPYTLYSTGRENKACVSLGALFIIAGIGVIIEGAWFLFIKDQPKWYTILVILAGVGLAVCIFLGALKYMLYRRIKSKSLFLDALNSLLSGLFALVIIVSDVVYSYDKNIWYLDPVLSIIFSLVLVAYGIYIIWGYFRNNESRPE